MLTAALATASLTACATDDDGPGTAGAAGSDGQTAPAAGFPRHRHPRFRPDHRRGLPGAGGHRRLGQPRGPPRPGRGTRRHVEGNLGRR
ncbi:hypothetical protein QP028_04360 [Corynebacterium suedekumii]|nr:hypothetical protein QP028_04360 [Corynebacterium suedekumii]